MSQILSLAVRAADFANGAALLGSLGLMLGFPVLLLVVMVVR